MNDDPLETLKTRLLRHRTLAYLTLSFVVLTAIAAGLNQLLDLRGKLRTGTNPETTTKASSSTSAGPPASTSPSTTSPPASADLTRAFPVTSFFGWTKIPDGDIDNTGITAQDYCDRRLPPPDARLQGIAYHRTRAATYVHVAEFRTVDDAMRFVALARQLVDECRIPWTPAARSDLAGTSFRVQSVPPPQVAMPPDELFRVRLTNSRDTDYTILDYIRAGRYVTLLTNNASQQPDLMPAINQHLNEASERLVKLRE